MVDVVHHQRSSQKITGESLILCLHLHQLAAGYFVEDKAFVKAFCFHSAAKSVHHGFVGGLLEHTLSVTKMCCYFAGA